MEVDSDNLAVMGDFYGRLNSIENIPSDVNGKMIEKWILDKNLYHLNNDKKCRGKYTYGRKGARSAVDHILVNDEMYNKFIGMNIDETGKEISFSDHNLQRAWFKLGYKHNTKWNKKGI